MSAIDLPVGIPGPSGPPGPEGPPGAGAVMLDQGMWKWTATVVGDFQITANHAGCDADSPPSATMLYIDETDIDGMDHSSIISTMRTGDAVFVFVENNPNSWQQWTMTGPAVNMGATGWAIPITNFAGSAAGTEPPSETVCIFQFRDTSTGQPHEVPNGGQLNQVLTKLSNADQALGWMHPTRVIKAITQNAHGFTAGQVLRLAGNAYATAKADAEANAEVVGIVYSVIDANTFILLTHGDTGGFSGLTVGSAYYLSPSVAGGLTATEPTTPGQVSKPVLLATAAATGWFINSRGFVIPPATPPTPNKPWDTAWGLVALATSLTLSQTTTASVDLPGMSVTFTAIAGRAYEFTWGVLTQSSVASERGSCRVLNAANTQIASAQRITAATAGQALSMERSQILLCAADIPAGSNLYKLNYWRLSGSGTHTISASTVDPAILAVKDVGPAL